MAIANITNNILTDSGVATSSLQPTISLTTTGTSGSATLVGATLNIPQYTDAYTGTVTSVAALTIGTTGTDLSSSVANSTTTPVITLNVPTASATNRGALSSADWTTFNNKQGTITLTTTGTSGAATFSANTLNIPNYADGGVLSLSAIGGTPNANAATITGTVLNLQPASASFGGVVTTGTQTFAGAKTFSSDLVVNGLKVGTGVMNIATNTAIGVSVLNAGTGSGDYNVGVGYNAMLVNINGAESVAVGAFSLKTNTNGGLNTAIGAYSLYLNTSGYYNTAVGHSALYYNTTGERNTAIGISALTAVTTGTYNIGIGESAGASITTGSKNTIVGRYLGTTTMANNVVLADGDGNVRFQWDGTNVLLNGNTAITKSGTGTTNYLPKFTGASTIGNSLVYDNGTNVGINTNSITYRLEVNAGTAQYLNGRFYGSSHALVQIESTTAGFQSLISHKSPTREYSVGLQGDGSYSIYDNTGAATRLVLSTSGNLGLGVTPSAWQSDVKAIQIGDVGSNISANNAAYSGGNNVWINNNSFQNSSVQDIYTRTAAAGQYQIQANTHIWRIAPSGTAGAAITFTQAMTLTAAGRLLINTPTESTYQLDVNGKIYSNDQIKVITSAGGVSGYFTDATNSTLQIKHASGYLQFLNGSNIAWLKEDGTGAATFSSSVGVGVSPSVKFQVNNGTNINLGIKVGQTDVTAVMLNAFNDALTANIPLEFRALSYSFTLGAATFSSSVHIPSSSSSGQGYYYFDYLSSAAASRTWRLAGDYNAYGDFVLQQSTTQTGSTFSNILRFEPTGAATFSSSVTATSFFESSDSRLKTLIQDNYQTKGIASITPKLYTKNGKVELGYYAQDFVGVLDSAVVKGSDDMLSLSYREVHTAKIYALEQRIKELESK